MSRVGKHMITVPAGVDVHFQDGIVTVKGSLGTMQEKIPSVIEFSKEGNFLKLVPTNKEKFTLSIWGTLQRKLSNHVQGVTKGFTVNLELSGVGYRAAVQGNNLQLQLGFSHDVVYPIPTGISIKCEKPTSIAVTGFDRQKVGQVAAEIRSYRPPEPYKGKGIIRQGEFVVRKEGKKK